MVAKFKNLFVLILFISCLFITNNTFAQASKPNIILILIDDQDMDEIGAYGGKVYTPNMDKLAAEGIKFNKAYVSSTVCTPSRYSFLTGRYAGQSYSKLYQKEVGADSQGFPGFNIALESDKMNVARVLGESGYTTGFTGKYHLMSKDDQPEMYNGDHTFIEGYKEGKSTQVNDTLEVSKIFAHNEAWGRKYLKHIGFHWAKNIYEGNLTKPFSAHNPEWTASAALEFLDENQDNPFFLQVCPTLLHGPDNQWVRSFDYPDYTGAGEIKAHPTVMKERQKLKEKLIKLGYNPKSGDWGYAWVDAMLGEIMNKLDELDIADNTLVIFAPDHGSTDKACLFSEDGARIPLIMKWPVGITAGIECDELVQNIDLAPTYFELAGSTIPEKYHIDGISLVSLFENGKANNWRDNLYFELGNSRAVMTHDWKYIANRYPKEEIEKIKKASPEDLPKLMAPLQRLGIGVRGANHPGFWDEDQLYNLDNDPREWNNLAYKPTHNKDLDKMKKILKEYIDNIGRPFGEFNYSGNAALQGQVKKEIKMLKQIKINGKNVILPEHFNN